MKKQRLRPTLWRDFRFVREIGAALAFFAAAVPLRAQWLPVRQVTAFPEKSEHAGEFLMVDYDLEVPDLTEAAPAYVFLRYSTDGGAHWRLAPVRLLRGDGHGIVTAPGRRTVLLWGSDQLGLTLESTDLKVAVRAIRMARVPGGSCIVRMMPGGGFDASKARIESAVLPTFHMAVTETTVGMYADYLNEEGRNGRGWNRLMANPERCGISRRDGDTYVVAAGRENHPINYVSWYEAEAFLEWCGLRLPSELEFVKASRGGLRLDGDESGRVENPKPERRFPWGDEEPGAEGLLRCNCEVADRNREARLMPVGSYVRFSSPYGIADLAGNVAEWTRDAYSTSYHNKTDGYRMIRGGSYLDPAAGCDAVAGASQMPAKRGSITGFRGVCAD